MIRNAMTGKFHQVYAADMRSSIFKDIKILEPLKTLKHVADYVSIRGDLPAKLRDELKQTLSTKNPGVGGHKLRKADAEIASKRSVVTRFPL